MTKPQDPPVRKRYLHCRRCAGKNLSTRKFCAECRKHLRKQAKQKTIDRERRARFSALASIVVNCGTAEAADLAYQQIIANWYLMGQWSEHSEQDHVWAIRQFQKDMAKWLTDPETCYRDRFRYMMAAIKAAELRETRRIQQHNGHPPKSASDLKKVPKKELITWIRKLMHDGYLKLDDLDPAPMIDLYDYGWNSE